jgi:hypothetical protein
VPLVASVPLQAPEAVQDVALVELQVSVELPPLATEVGLAVSVTVGAGVALPTVTVTEATLLVSPAPRQLSEYEVVAVSAPVLWVPLVASVPLHPPEAVQEVALVELQVSVVAPPLVIEVCSALSDAVGRGLVTRSAFFPHAESSIAALSGTRNIADVRSKRGVLRTATRCGSLESARFSRSAVAPATRANQALAVVAETHTLISFNFR